MKDLAFKMWCKAQFAKQQIKERFTSEEGGADGIIIAIIIIIIVVALGIVFRDQIGQWFTDLATSADSQIGNAGKDPGYTPV